MRYRQTAAKVGPEFDNRRYQSSQACSQALTYLKVLYFTRTQFNMCILRGKTMCPTLSGSSWSQKIKNIRETFEANSMHTGVHHLIVIGAFLNQATNSQHANTRFQAGRQPGILAKEGTPKVIKYLQIPIYLSIFCTEQPRTASAKVCNYQSRAKLHKTCSGVLFCIGLMITKD